MHRFGLVGLLGLFGLACGSSTSDPSTSVSPLNGCLYTFQVTITDGPSAGLNMNGVLVLFETEPGVLEGRFATADGQSIEVGGGETTGADGSIGLVFDRGDGKVIVGQGPMAQAISSCATQGPIQGVAVGPTISADNMVSDRGTWIGTPSYTITGGIKRGSTGSTDIVVNVPPEVIQNCNSHPADSSCFQRFCDAQHAGTFVPESLSCNSN
jgi:hypothetical protein